MGCSSSGGKSVALRDEQLRAYPNVAAYLQVRGTLPTDSTNRVLTIRKGGQTAGELSCYLDALRLQYATVQANIANADTLADESMNNRPYRRQFAVMRADGGFEVRLDETPLPRLYLPTHPLADKTGFVLMTNVDMATEQVELRRVVDDYEMVRSTLMRLEPGRTIGPLDATTASGNGSRTSLSRPTAARSRS
jgi:flagellar basal-body rod protein FlgC